MNRPEGLALTAWIMVVLNTVGLGILDWGQYYRLHPPGVLWLVIVAAALKIVGFVCIWYYFQGRNWARVMVLLTSAVMVWNARLLLQNHQQGIVWNARPPLWNPLIIRVVIAANAILGAFFLYG
jgi:hypothetical protein